jgi:hypothetical protein
MERSSRPIPSGACSAKSARCSFENSFRSGCSPRVALRTSPARGIPLDDPEQT